MKKVISLFIFSFLIANGLFSEQRNPIDLIVVMDSSAAMYDQYQEVTEYAVGPLLKEFLRIGDTFHLISFSSSSRTELSRRIESSGDIETIIARMLLMYPLNPYSDVIQALEYSSRYVSGLPENRGKTVLFISDGLHAAGPDSMYAGYSPEAVKESIEAASRKLRGNGWTFHFIRVPLTNEQRTMVQSEPGTLPETKLQDGTTGSTADTIATGSGQSDTSGQVAGDTGDQVSGDTGNQDETGPVDVSQTVSDNLLTPIVEFNGEEDPAIISTIVGAVSVRFPEDIGKTGRKVIIPLEVNNPSDTTIYLETRQILVDGEDLMDRRSFIELKERSTGTLRLRVLLPENLDTGLHTKTIEPLFTGSTRINPSSGTITFLLEESAFAKLIGKSLPILLFLLGLLLAAFIAILILFVIRRLNSAPNRVTSGAMASSGYRKQDKTDDELAAYKAHTASSRSETPAYTQSNDAAEAAALLNAAASSRQETDRTQAGNKGEKHESSSMHSVPGSNKAATATGHDKQATSSAPVFAVNKGSDQNKGKLSGDSISAPPYKVRKENERVMLSLFVEDQNTAIGKRNVHLLKAGNTLTLGGKRSDFLVFLVPIPHRIADVRFDGEIVSIIPRKPQYFPDTGSEPIHDCIGEKIRLISDKGYELFIRLDMYQDPLKKLNDFLHSIELPGVKTN